MELIPWQLSYAKVGDFEELINFDIGRPNFNFDYFLNFNFQPSQWSPHLSLKYCNNKKKYII